MSRYFIELAYCGTRYFGWQRQPGKDSVQQTLEESMCTILGAELDITGCGRTDTGVHARQYFAHFDFEGEFPTEFVRRLNKYLPKDIAVYRIFAVPPNAHARFDAYQRSYEYRICFRKDPFAEHLAYFYPFPQNLDQELMQAAAALLLQYSEFAPFCKSDHDAKTLRCTLSRAEWIFEPSGQSAMFHITSNRFLRGMVRLIVGMCLGVGNGQIVLEEVKVALDAQTRLQKASSAPPEGLYLGGILYDWGRLGIEKN
jgi:tRNA pseudouridine38-40 synthase